MTADVAGSLLEGGRLSDYDVPDPAILSCITLTDDNWEVFNGDRYIGVDSDDCDL